jgi:hypothetical protein
VFSLCSGEGLGIRRDLEIQLHYKGIIFGPSSIVCVGVRNLDDLFVGLFSGISGNLSWIVPV